MTSRGQSRARITYEGKQFFNARGDVVTEIGVQPDQRREVHTTYAYDAFGTWTRRFTTIREGQELPLASTTTVTREITSWSPQGSMATLRPARFAGHPEARGGRDPAAPARTTNRQIAFRRRCGPTATFNIHPSAERRAAPYQRPACFAGHPARGAAGHKQADQVGPTRIRPVRFQPWRRANTR